MRPRHASPRRRQAAAVVAVVVTLAAVAAETSTSTAQSPTGRAPTTGTAPVAAGLITGRVTGPNGQPLAGISVVAAPAANDTELTQATTDANGDYALVVAPGSYDVAFNALDPIDGDFAAQVYGGPGPSAADSCLVCHGQPQIVTNGGVTAGISAVLRPPVQKGTIRALSGGTIKVLANRISFRFGCHEDGIGCVGKGVLRLGTSTRGPVVSTVHFQVQSNRTATLHFTIPRSVAVRLKQARHHALAAVVALTTVPSSTTTKFTLVARP